MCISPIQVPIKCNGKAFTDVVRTVPCGSCIACRLNHARMWSLRIMHEASLWPSSIFLTLTYDEEHLPKDKSIHKEEIQNFMKRLRKALAPRPVRYFASGEYGENYGRPHYHLILFNVDKDCGVFENLHWNMKHKGYDGQCNVWNKGRVSVDDVNINSANYVAKYCLKKVKGKGAEEHYKELGIEPEFCLMSRMPGIGVDYMREHYDKLKRDKFIKVRDVKFPLPRYYDDNLFLDEKVERSLEKSAYRHDKDKRIRDYCRKNGLDYEQYMDDVRSAVNKSLKFRKNKGELNE